MIFFRHLNLFWILPHKLCAVMAWTSNSRNDRSSGLLLLLMHIVCHTFVLLRSYWINFIHLIHVFQIGKTKVFLRAGQMAELDTRRSEVLGKSASIIQRKIRSYLARRSFVLLRRSALQLQAACRGIQFYFFWSF